MAKYLYSILDSFKNFFYRHHHSSCECLKSIPKAVDIESAPFHGAHLMNEEYSESSMVSHDGSEEDESEECHDSPSPVQSLNGDEKIGQLDSIDLMEEEEASEAEEEGTEYRDEVIMMETSDSEECSSEYSEEDEESSTDSLQLQQPPSNGFIGRVWSMIGGGKYPDADTDAHYGALFKYNNGKLNPV